MGKRLHVLTSKNTEARTGICQHCGPVAIRLKVSVWRCFNSIKQHRGIHRSKIQKGPHGVMYVEARKLKVGRVCAICGSAHRLVIDHCHDTKQLRGILCNECNTAIGMLKDDPKLLQRAAKYLSTYNKKQSPLDL